MMKASCHIILAADTVNLCQVRKQQLCGKKLFKEPQKSLVPLEVTITRMGLLLRFSLNPKNYMISHYEDSLLPSMTLN